MGMSYTGFGAPVTTKNLQANADLDLGGYDLIATDVKGDTAEFDEFVGGVGNFTNVLGSGNLDIEGTGNVKGLTTFQDGVQVNGSLHVEGSINNVNIADNGEITTAQGVNGADFNGAKITSTKFNGATIDASGNVTGVKGTFSGAVSGTTGTFSGAVSGTTGTFSGAVSGTKFTRSANYTVSSSTPANYSTNAVSLPNLTCILPIRDKPYNGSVILKRKTVSSGLAYAIKYITTFTQTAYSEVTMPATTNGTCTISLSNASCLYLDAGSSDYKLGNITIS